jgi:hypothetical protein
MAAPQALFTELFRSSVLRTSLPARNAKQRQKTAAMRPSCARVVGRISEGPPVAGSNCGLALAESLAVGLVLTHLYAQ